MTESNHNIGVIIPNKTIYDEVQALKIEFTKFKAYMTVAGLFVVPVISAIVTTLVNDVTKG